MEDKKKVGLVAVSNHNYGSQLQTYAMHYILEEFGVENEIIKYRPKILNQLKRALNLSFIIMKSKSVSRNILCKIKYPDIAVGLSKRAEEFEHFKKSNLHYSPTISDRKQLVEYVKKYKAVILGSDQVWHPANLEMDFFTLNFVADNIPKIAYAPSFGVSSIPKNQMKKTKSFLERIDEISVRETVGTKIVKELTGRDVPVVCDPTALLDRSQWDSIRINQKYTDEKYIFCYFLGANKLHREFVENVKRITGYKIIALQHLDELVKDDIEFGDIKPFDVAPGNFIDLIANAEIVFTDSFHGTMFSVYYHKNFYTFSRFSDNEKESTNSRIMTILKMLGLEMRHYSALEEPASCLNMSVDWEAVDDKLNAFRYDSQNYLKKAINKYQLINLDRNYKTIAGKNKRTCTGCTACVHSCPQKCINMEEDVEGFLYPVIDKKKCIECGICKNVCPVDNKYNLNVGVAFAARSSCKDIRMNSSSGGVFSALSEYVLENGGIVVGAAFDEEMQVSHIAIDKQCDLKKLQASKYVQSDLKNTFSEIRDYLDRDRFVLFCGTPCQASGLKHFLKRNYEKLIIVDVLCYGVPSPGIFRKFISYMEKKHNSKITEFYFRDKTFGYSSPNIKAIFENGETEQMTSDIKSFTKTFFSGVTIRPACFECKFKGVGKEVDITLGDFWSIGEVDKTMDDETGATLVFAHTKKGIDILNETKNILLKEIDMDVATKHAGYMLLNTAVPNLSRQEFFENIEVMEYEKCVNYYIPDSLKNKVANVVKPIMLRTGLTRTGILKKVKKIKMAEEGKR